MPVGVRVVTLVEKPQRMNFSIFAQEVVGMAVQTADGMLYLSSQGIVHRDLAVRNLLLDEHRNVKVSDFGLSRSVDGKGAYQASGTQVIALL